jgi:hypothetical protein
MTRGDFLKLIGAESKSAEYVPVAFLLKSGYAALGYFNATINDGLNDAVVFLNVLLTDLAAHHERGRHPIRDFNEFLEEVVTAAADADKDELPVKPDLGRRTPLAAFPLSELAVVYPVSQISELVKRSKERGRSLPTFFDLSKSEILGLLHLRPW